MRVALGYNCFSLALAIYELTGVPVLNTETVIELWTGNNGFLFRHYPQESSDIRKELLTPPEIWNVDCQTRLQENAPALLPRSNGCEAERAGRAHHEAGIEGRFQ